jgi:hypothetical protein
MEYASYLAGERWSDHPQCTHPLLAGVARGVNDRTSDEARPRLVGLIPSVVGLTSDDPKVDARIAIRSAAIALPVVAEHRQLALAAGLLTALRYLSDLDGDQASPETAALLDHVHRALADAPHAARWAERFVAAADPDPGAFRRRSAPAVVRVAVDGIAEACVPDPDELLFELLTTVIQDCQGAWSSEASGDGPAWGEGVQHDNTRAVLTVT